VPSHRDPHKLQQEDAVPTAAAEHEGLADADATASTAAASDPTLAEQLQKLLAEKQDLMNTLVRRQADFENFRKRIEKERHQDRHRAVESLIEHILPALDAFDRAIASHDDPAYAEYNKGIELIRRQLWDALAKQGLERIESIGKDFNPHFHHAIEQVQTAEHAEGTVVDELQPGYVFHGRVLRPAMVRVASGSTTASRAEK
jgi:molecular chaperone GrpE